MLLFTGYHLPVLLPRDDEPARQLPGVDVWIGGRMIVNWYAANRGWLFEDLKRHAVRVADAAIEAEDPLVTHAVADMARFPVIDEPQFRRALADSAESPVVIASDEPVEDADVWVCVRTSEGVKSPDLSRTVVQIHDLFTEPHDYQATSPRGIAYRQAGALCFTHASQPDRICRLPTDRIMCRPIGALEAFTPRTADDRQDVFTVGWSGRPVKYQGRELKRVALFVEAVKLLGPPVRVLMIGDGLEEYAMIHGALVEVHSPSRRYPGQHWEDYAPALYRQMDSFCSTSESPAVPLGCYEALASGVPVFSTPREWPHTFAGTYWSEDARMMAKQLSYLRDGVPFAGEMGPKMDPGSPESIAGSVSEFTLESWCRENTALAVGLDGDG